MTRFLGSWLDTSQDFFNNIKQEVLDLDALELSPEGRVAQYLLLLPELLNGDLLQGSGVMNGCGENKIIFYLERR